jgi:hypothetical protein
LASPATLISNNRIYGALNINTLSNAINTASNGDAQARNAIRESVRGLITIVENAQLDSALQNNGTSVSPPATSATQPAPAVSQYTPAAASLPPAASAPSQATTGGLVFPPPWAPISEKQAFYSSPEYHAYRFAESYATAPRTGGDTNFDNYSANAVNSFISNNNIQGFVSFSQMTQASRMNDLRKVQQQAAALGYHMTLDDILTMANGGSVSFTRSASNPETRVSTSLQAPDGSAVLTVTANRATINAPSAALLGTLGASAAALIVAPSQDYQTFSALDWGDPIKLRDRDGDVILDANGNFIYRPSNVDVAYMYELGLANKDASFFAFNTTLNRYFNQGGSYDFQRQGGSFHEGDRILDSGFLFHPEFVSFSTIAIGAFAAGAGLSEQYILNVQNGFAARNSNFGSNVIMDSTYTYLPRINVANTRLGYALATGAR